MTSPLDYSGRLKDCIIQAIVGDMVGSGAYRTVFALDDKRVLKVEADGLSFSNQHEWTLWQDVQGTRWERWFAPCLGIDAYGAALIMARTQPLTDEQWKALRRVPSFMADVKRDNWGWLDGKPVCHDYGNHRFFVHGFKSAKMVGRE